MLTLRATRTQERDPDPSPVDTSGMTEPEAERARTAEALKAGEPRLVQVYEDGVHLGSLRDVLANYPARRAQVRALVDAERAKALASAEEVAK